FILDLYYFLSVFPLFLPLTSVCTSCTLCEPCSFSHDPSHNLVRARTPLSIPEHGSPAPDHSRFYRRGDRSFRKAEKQRLKAEKRLLKAEVKEIRKQLRMERRGIQWSSSYRDGSSSPILLQPRRPCPLVVPAMMATFLDENLPDGTRLRPATKFIKYWKMRNTGTISWGADTKLKFMWGNLAVGSGDRWREVSVPFLQPGQIGIVSVALCAPVVEGSYTSHWRLAHAGEQFGPRVWCSIMVDPLAPAPMMADGILVSPCVTPQNPVVKDGKACTTSREPPLMSVDQEEYYIPSVDLLTAQDLLSFELLDINIVQELESVPNNTPTGKKGYSCLQLGTDIENKKHPPHQEGPAVPLLPEDSEMHWDGIPAQEEGRSDISRTQFVCETVIHSITLEESPDHAPLKESHLESICLEDRVKAREKEPDKEKEKEGEEKGEGTRSRSSSTSSEDYIIILPDCFDTSRPLGESMYRTTVDGELYKAGETAIVAGTELSGNSSANDMLCTSQTLDDEPLTPEVVVPSKAIITSRSKNKLFISKMLILQMSLLRHPGITSGLVKGALSVAASAYKALFTGQVDASTQDTMMAVLVEMGFGDRPLNQQLLKKHNYNLLDVVNELVQMTDNDWYSTRY
uniref:NBR1 autophagy cargo receptor b n=1 Tax=Stegastes partitus TaxID=144197 RepID=A0A3B5A9W6_9TELE